MSTMRRVYNHSSAHGPLKVSPQSPHPCTDNIGMVSHQPDFGRHVVTAPPRRLSKRNHRGSATPQSKPRKTQRAIPRKRMTTGKFPLGSGPLGQLRGGVNIRPDAVPCGGVGAGAGKCMQAFATGFRARSNVIHKATSSSRAPPNRSVSMSDDGDTLSDHDASQHEQLAQQRAEEQKESERQMWSRQFGHLLLQEVEVSYRMKPKDPSTERTERAQIVFVGNAKKAGACVGKATSSSHPHTEQNAELMMSVEPSAAELTEEKRDDDDDDDDNASTIEICPKKPESALKTMKRIPLANLTGIRALPAGQAAPGRLDKCLMTARQISAAKRLQEKRKQELRARRAELLRRRGQAAESVASSELLLELEEEDRRKVVEFSVPLPEDQIGISQMPTDRLRNSQHFGICVRGPLVYIPVEDPPEFGAAPMTISCNPQDYRGAHVVWARVTPALGSEVYLPVLACSAGGASGPLMLPIRRVPTTP
mmetsp:Transcript_44676/g.94993  ORF Transcript_44676/g.94993 Transcript_44676/m.94993 type:complete len:479 (-) Transcript_44676:339-1775(-)